MQAFIDGSDAEYFEREYEEWLPIDQVELRIKPKPREGYVHPSDLIRLKDIAPPTNFIKVREVL